MSSDMPTSKKIEPLPRHIAIIMDGNGRWAKKQKLPRLEGYHAGLESTRRAIRYLSKMGVGYITLYGFSTENWNRPKQEITDLFNLMAKAVKSDTLELHQNNIKVNHIGRLDRIPANLKQTLEESLRITAGNSGMVLTLAFDYGGRSEIIEAIKRIVKDSVPPQNIDEELLSSYLYTADLPEVDYLIRTSGEYRLSNFLLWQSAYAEYYFTDVLWPDFDEKEIEKALRDFSRRQRRFGSV
jgi:undecaprenyl diphosphate synthase